MPHLLLSLRCLQWFKTSCYDGVSLLNNRRNFEVLYCLHLESLSISNLSNFFLTLLPEGWLCLFPTKRHYYLPVDTVLYQKCYIFSVENCVSCLVKDSKGRTTVDIKLKIVILQIRRKNIFSLSYVCLLIKYMVSFTLVKIVLCCFGNRITRRA